MFLPAVSVCAQVSLLRVFKLETMLSTKLQTEVQRLLHLIRLGINFACAYHQLDKFALTVLGPASQDSFAKGSQNGNQVSWQKHLSEKPISNCPRLISTAVTSGTFRLDHFLKLSTGRQRMVERRLIKDGVAVFRGALLRAQYSPAHRLLYWKHSAFPPSQSSVHAYTSCEAWSCVGKSSTREINQMRTVIHQSSGILQSPTPYGKKQPQNLEPLDPQVSYCFNAI